MKVLVTGACGYKGSVLMPKLKDHEAITLDIGWFGGKPDIRQDIRDLWRLYQDIKFDAIIHLAGIANDPCGDLDAKLTWEVNVLGTMRLADWAARSGVKQFIFASSASVYGVKGARSITEDMPLEPVSDYNKTKMCAERVLLSYSDKMIVQIIRPATVCGISPRMRLDTMVNMLTMQALEKGEITAHCGEHGGDLMRPNIHIDDITDLYVWLLEHPEVRGIYNAGWENLSVMETAEKIAKRIPCEIKITKVADKRSYRIDSGKLLKAGFKPRKSVGVAIAEIQEAYRKGLRPQPNMTNLTWMASHGWAA